MNSLQANQQGPAGQQNTQELQSMYSEILSMCPYVPCRNERNAVPNQEKKYVLVCTEYIPVHTIYEPEVCTWYILLTSSLYFKTYIPYQYVQVCTRYILGTYLRIKVCTRYILGLKSMYRVQTSLCRFIAIRSEVSFQSDIGQ